MRFIEWMPLDAGGGWDVGQVVGQDEIVARIDAVYPLEQLAARGAAPADRWRYRDGGGTVGVIPSVTKPFCGDCDRVRLTADGQFRTCLFATDETDLRAALRSGESDDQLAARIERPSPGSGPATTSTRSTSSARRDRCPRSAADAPSVGVFACGVHCQHS